MKRKQLFFILFLMCCAVVQAKEYHVSIYRAAPGEKVEIKVSERISNCSKEKDDVWKVTIGEMFLNNNSFMRKKH
ncbi:hypothetical protein NXY11_16050 [Parabacteroides faecis]|uniref:hypothetical protein n=1 Tax=Parabacteroides faecis TaxID=1217282 RepID=UPI002164A5C6|nr:hypothetical protein [Parabacteroides faecis]MCS2891684.1 hypothetical protein [Parabacteroides faecis]UVQ44702.1 hypothetical protein NXY11_16050 [Parabacteroides faecis]